MGEKKEKDLVDGKLFERARRSLDKVTGPRAEGVHGVSEEQEEARAYSGVVEKERAYQDRGEALVNVEGLSKIYGDGDKGIRVLNDVNLSVYSGEMVAVMGPSGCGKSTLLFILGLFLSASGGSYYFNGREVLRLGRSAQAEFRSSQVGFVFQSADLLENSTVYENLEFPLIYAGVGRRKRSGLISRALGVVDLEHRIRHSANQLSGGEKQRVAVARALVNRPRVILADEPTGQLDRDNTQKIMDHLAEIVSTGETAVIVVTHDPQVADRCSQVYSLVDGRLFKE